MNLDTEFVLCKQQIHHKVANIPLLCVPNIIANISLWSSPTLHQSTLNIAEFLHFLSQNASVKKFASYLALKSIKLCDCSLVFLSPFIETYYSNSVK